MQQTWKKIVDNRDQTFHRGCVFRTPGEHPYESRVDFMLLSAPDSPSEYQLIVVTGYKAGLSLVNLPKEGLSTKSQIHGIDAAWLIANWNKWIYKSDPSQVTYIEHYPAPTP